MREQVLIATPARLSTPRALLARCEELVHGFTYPGVMEWRLHLNEKPWSTEKYRPHAQARNELIERYLKPWHEWVLWMDVDIVAAPANLIEGLMEVAERRARPWKDGVWLPGTVAPMVWVERVGEGPASIPVGGWFYDIGGFLTAKGERADFEHGLAKREPWDGEEMEMGSVGCVYLTPAALYREGLRYAPEGCEVEHVSFFRKARAKGADGSPGAGVWATRQLNVVHAYLPKYGAEWNS